MIEDRHLGDGVYASFDGYHIWLAVNDHRHKVVALEPAVLAALVQYNDDLQKRIKEAMAPKEEPEPEGDSLNSNEHMLLEWLGKEDSSLYGECKGASCDRLFTLGHCEWADGRPEDQDYWRVRLTDKGRSKLKELGKWEPYRG